MELLTHVGGFFVFGDKPWDIDRSVQEEVISPTPPVVCRSDQIGYLMEANPATEEDRDVRSDTILALSGLGSLSSV
jgi:hypothetical protein